MTENPSFILISGWYYLYFTRTSHWNVCDSKQGEFSIAADQPCMMQPAGKASLNVRGCTCTARRSRIQKPKHMKNNWTNSLKITNNSFSGSNNVQWHESTMWYIEVRESSRFWDFWVLLSHYKKYIYLCPLNKKSEKLSSMKKYFNSVILCVVYKLRHRPKTNCHIFVQWQLNSKIISKNHKI